MWPVGQVVKTAASHAAIRSSTLLRVTIEKVLDFKFIVWYTAYHEKGGKERKIFFSLLTFFFERRYIVGADCSEGPPVPIPNTEVKLVCAHDTWLETARENR